MTTWIKLFTALPRHPKTLRLARALRVRARDAWSTIASVWIYAAEFSASGDVTDLCADPVAVAALLEIEIDHAEDVVLQLVASGFLDRDGDRIVIHDWADGGGALEYQRERNRQKQAAFRSRNAGKDDSNRLRDGYVPLHNRQEEMRGEENRKELGANAPLSACADEPSGNPGELKPKKANGNGKIAPTEFETAVMDAYNRHCGDVLTRVRALDSKRRRNIRDLAAAGHGLAEFETAFRHAASQSFLRGRNDRKWIADFEFCTRPDKFTKLLEGHQWGADSASQTRMPLADGEVWGG